MASEIPTKRRKSAKDVPYHLVYWPGIPGRGEHVRLLLEEAQAEYSEGDMIEIQALINGDAPPDDGANIPVFACPILKHGDLYLHQTPNILLYLARRHSLVPDEESDSDGVYRVNALALTAFDGLR